MWMEIPHLKITRCCRQCELVPIHSRCVSVFADTAEEGLERVCWRSGGTTQQVKVFVAKSDDLSSFLKTYTVGQP